MWSLLTFSFLGLVLNNYSLVMALLSVSLVLLMVFSLDPFFACNLTSLFSVDTVTIIFVFLKMFMMAMTLQSMKSYKTKSQKQFIFFCMALLTAVKFAFLVKSWVYFYIFFELSMPPIVFIILGWGYQPERMLAASYLFIYTMVGSLPLLAVMVSSLINSESLFFQGASNYSQHCYTKKNTFFLLFWVLAFLIKSPMFGFHLWLPKAHVEAPVGGSMFLAAVLLKLGSYGLLRVKIFNMFSSNLLSSGLMMWVAVTILFSGFICFRSTDLKALIAYSSVLHMGVVLLAMFLLDYNNYLGLIFMSLGHGFMSSCMFFVVKMFYGKTNSRSMVLNGGNKYIFSLLSLFWFFCLVLNCSAPPFITLLSEMLIASTLMKMSYLFLISFGFSVFCSGLFSIYLYMLNNHGTKSSISSSKNMSFLKYLQMWLHVVPGLFIVFYLSTFFN